MNVAIKNYTYDTLGRLTDVKVTDRANNTNISQKSYTYDKVGNRLTETDSSGTKTYSYNNLNELLNIKKDDTILTRYFYDKNGNEIKEVSGTTVVNKQYDINNQMITYDKYEDGKNTFFVDSEYNYNGQRKEKTVSTPYQDTGTLVGNSVYYYYSNGGLLYTTNTSNKMLSANILNLEGNVISSTRNDNNFYAYNKDIRNSTSSIVNQYNNGVVAYEYDEFGNTEQLVNQEFDNEICYTGGIYDKETGEYYLNARHYDPSIARFTSVDTYRGETKEPLSLHLYAYCANNPINFVDPSGHKYNRGEAKRYAIRYAYGHNGNYPNYDRYGNGDCTNFTSQCVFAGGKPMKITGKRTTGWYCVKQVPLNYWVHSNSWSVAPTQYKYFKKHWSRGIIEVFKKEDMKKIVKNPKKHKIYVGDMIYFSTTEEEGDIFHSSIITTSRKGKITYCGHTQSPPFKSLPKAYKKNSKMFILKIRK